MGAQVALSAAPLVQEQPDQDGTGVRVEVPGPVPVPEEPGRRGPRGIAASSEQRGADVVRR